MGKPIVVEKQHMPEKQIAKKLNEFLLNLGYEMVVGERGDHLYAHCNKSIRHDEIKLHMTQLAEKFCLNGRFTRDAHYYLHPGSKHRFSVRFDKKRVTVVHTFRH